LKNSSIYEKEAEEKKGIVGVNITPQLIKLA
jgi:hypothetical protein